MLSIDVLGPSATAARLPSVGFILLTAVLTYVLGRSIYSRETGFIAAVVVLTTRLIFFGYHGGRAAALDVTLLFFGTLAVGAVFLGVRRDHLRSVLLPVAGIAIGLAILSKGFGAGVFALIALPLFVVHWRAFLTREGMLAAGLAVVVPLAWFVVAELIYGDVLIYMFRRVLLRLDGSLNAYPATFEFMKAAYFRNAPEQFDPWWYLLLTALVTVPLGIYRRHGRSRLGSDTLFLCWWTLSVFGFFVATGNHFWYVMPMVVPIGLLCGRVIDRGFRPSPEAAGLVVGSSLTFMHSPLVGRAIHFVTGGVISPSPPARFALVVVWGGVLIAVIYREQWQPALRPQIDITEWAGLAKRVFVISLVLLIILQLPVADSWSHNTSSQKQLGQQFLVMTPTDTTVYVNQPAPNAIYPFVFYAQRPLQSVPPEQLNTNPEVQYALLKPSVAKQLRRPHERIGSMTAYDKQLVLIEFVTVPSRSESFIDSQDSRLDSQSLNL